MAINDTNILDDDDDSIKPSFNKKKILLIILPILIAIGLSVGFFYTIYKSSTPDSSLNYSVVNPNAENNEEILIFYDLPEIAVNIKTSSKIPLIAKLKINIELSKIEDIKTLESFIPRINDAIITHMSELTPEELRNSDRMSWLKEELLYRLNLILSPIVINNLNLKNFEVVTSK